MELSRRPLAFTCIIFVISAVVGYFFIGISFLIGVALFSVGVLTMTVGSIFAKRRLRTVLLVAVLLFSASLGSFLSYSHFGAKTAAVEKYFGEEVEIVAAVRDVSYKRSYGACYDIETQTINGEPTELGMQLEAESSNFEKGDVFSMRVLISSFDDNVAGEYKLSSMARGLICSCIQVSEDAYVQEKGKSGFFDCFFRMSDAVSERFDSALSKRGAGLYRAVFAGDDGGIEGADMLSVRRAGASHLLAVSGMHFSTIMAMLLFVLKKTGLSVGKRSVLLMSVAFIYCAFTGFSASVVRSGIMLCITYLGALAGRLKDSFTALFIAMALMIAATPYIILDASFWLSSSATLGIILFSPLAEKYFSKAHNAPLSDILRDGDVSLLHRMASFFITAAVRAVRALPKLLISSVFVSVFALAFSLPFSVLFFDCMSICSVPCGLVLSPLITVVIATSPVIMLFCDSVVISSVCSFIGEAFFEITRFFSSYEDAYVFVNYPPTRILIALFIASVILFSFVMKKQKPLAFVCILLVIAVPVSSFIYDRTVYSAGDFAYSATKDTDALAIRTDEGVVLADMGSDSRAEIRGAVDASSGLNSSYVHAFIFTTADTRTANALRYLVTLVEVGCVYFPDYAAEKGRVTVDSAAEYASSEGIEVRYFRYGESFDVYGCKIIVSEIEYLDRSGVELYSVGARCGDESVLWTSESFFEGEKCTAISGEEWGTLIFGRYGPKTKESSLPKISYADFARCVCPAENEDYYLSKTVEGKTRLLSSVGKTAVYLKKSSDLEETE